MAKSAAIPLTFAGIASILIISGIEGESLGEVLKGEFGTGTKHPLPNPEAKPGGGSPESLKGFEGETNVETGPKITSGTISPFPKNSILNWGRSDKGVDGITLPGIGLRAMGDGVVEIHEDPSGFGKEYPVLHINGDGAFYYGHTIPLVRNGEHVKKGQVIAQANTTGWGNQHTPGGFEIGAWGPNGPVGNGASIRSWLIGLPRQ